MARLYASPQPPTPPPPAPPPRQSFGNSGAGGLDIASLRSLLRETVQESISPLQCSLSTLEKRVLALEQRDAPQTCTGKGVAAACTGGKSAASPPPPQLARPAHAPTQPTQAQRRQPSNNRSVSIPPMRTRSRPPSDTPRQRSSPPTKESEDLDSQHSKRLSRLVLGKVPEPLSRDEMYDAVNSLLVLPDACRVL
eukprot:4937691-Amphidinium_carterae.1